MIKIRINPIKLIIFLLLLCLRSFSFGQMAEMQFSNPINDRGFNSKDILSIAQDSAGFIWIGTDNGLYCYYGDKLTSYKSDPNDSTSIPGDGVRKLFTDTNGTLWILTHLGLCTYNGCFDNFERIHTDSLLPADEYLSLSSINQDNENNIYFSGNSNIYIFNADSKTSTLFLELDSMTISDFVFDENNNLWISTNNGGGLFFYNPKENKTERFIYDEKNGNSLSNNTIQDIAFEGDSILWIGTYGGGVNLLDIKTRTFKRYISDDTYLNYIVYTYIDKQNNLWICDLNGLKWYDRNNDKFIQHESFTSKEYNVKQNPKGIMQDQQGNYWTIYSSGGIGYWFTPQGIQFYNDDPSNFFHTTNNNISEVAIDKHGALWIGNGNDGIDIFDWKNHRRRTYHSDQNNPHSLGEGKVFCIYKDRQDKMWIGTNLGGLQYYDEDNDRFITYVNDPQNPNSISNNNIYDIVETKEGNFWVSTHGQGIDFFNTEEQKFYHYTDANSNLSNNWVYQLLIDSGENLWVASTWGISKLKKGDNIFQTYLYDVNDTNTISNTLINCLFEDSKKQIWIGTLDGICKYNSQTDNFTRYQTEFTSQNICAIEEGKNGNLWISTLTGVSEFDPETGEIIHNLYELDELQECVFSYRGSVKNDEGILFFACQSGIVYFNPEKLVFNVQIPEVHITSFYLFNQKNKISGNNEATQDNINCKIKIELEHNQNSIGIEFASTNYIYAARNRFKYKLEGIDYDWIETTDGKATYNYLPPGSYIFRVVTANNDDVWSNTGTSINIIIHKPWWFSWWFISIVISVFLLLVLLIFRVRMAALKAEKSELEKQVQIRTKDLYEKNILLKDQKTELNESYLLLKNQKQQIEQQSDKLKEIADNLTVINKELSMSNATKDKLFSIIAHDLINPFNTILGFTSMLIENFDSWNESKKIKFLNYINDSSNSAFSLLQNLLQWARSQKGEIEFRPENLKVSSEFDIVLNEVSYLAIKKEIQIVNLLKDEKLTVFFDSDIIQLILRNLLMNAIKFSNSESSIFIDAKEVEDNSILFSVRDQGIGMKSEYASAIFNPAENFSISEGTSGEKGVGLGLELCKEFITNHKGNIWVESSPGEGSTFFFTIPKNYDSRNPD